MVAVMSYEDIIVTSEGHVDVLTINRPEAKNSLTHRTYAELEEAVRGTEARCLIVTGSEDSFCAGDDVKKVMANPDDKPGERLGRDPRITPLADALLNTDVPVVAAINGYALGWGMELALMADIRVASNRASFGELFVLRGLNCDVAGLGRLAGAIGREKTAEMLFTGDVIGADMAREIGLVGRVVAHDDLATTAMDIAQRIAASPPLAVQAIKQGLREALDPDWDDVGTWVASNLSRLFASNDHKEGVASFLEKRSPNFTGS
ncbi:MAG: enoyl-CoA hydratase/isomerase family protein [Actinomycetia bacterium]|nr:enoyl-CoA hydratase/isomerase family protein [Actinomycetes bacterium]MCP5034630.1 enoyl-CoA hydratase/isomerase family protein [Actinomycetes bacterium]